MLGDAMKKDGFRAAEHFMTAHLTLSCGTQHYMVDRWPLHATAGSVAGARGGVD